MGWRIFVAQADKLRRGVGVGAKDKAAASVAGGGLGTSTRDQAEISRRNVEV